MKYLKLDESGSNEELTVQYNSDGTVTYSTSKALPDYIGEEIDKKMPTNIGTEVQKELATYTGEATSLDAGTNPTCEFDAANKKVKIGVPKGAATVVQNTGTSESSVMSQKAATDKFAVGTDILQPTNVTLQGTKSIELSDRQVELLEARDVISVEVCAAEFNRDNRYNRTTAQQYLYITFGDKETGSRIKCKYDGTPAYRACGVAASGNWMNVAHGITTPMGYDRWIMVIDRKKGRIALYDRPGSLIQEETDETLFKADSFFGGVKCIGISADNTNLFALRIYDHDISLIDRKEMVLAQKKEVFNENLLPYSYPAYYNNSINVVDKVIESSFWLTNLTLRYPLPYYCGVRNKAYKDDEGLHMISDKAYTSGDTTTIFSCGGYATPSLALCSKTIFKITFKVKQGSVKFNSAFTLLVNSGVVDSDGNSYAASDTLGVGTYTMECMLTQYMSFCISAEANTEVVLVKTEYYVPRLVVSLDCHTVFKNKVYDAIWYKWYESKVTEGFTTVGAWTFGAEQYGALSPATLSKPARRGDMKIDADGNIYIGVVNGATQVWKKVNNA